LPGKNGRYAKKGNGSTGPNSSETIATAITEVSERMTRLVHDEIELAKAEMEDKAKSLLRGAGAVAAGAVFGVFAVIFFLLTLAWVIDGIFVTGTGSIWLGFLVVLVVLLVLTVGAFLFAWRKLKVGVPAPTMAIDEAKKIRETMSAKPAVPTLAAGNGHATVNGNGVVATGGAPAANRTATATGGDAVQPAPAPVAGSGTAPPAAGGAG
jgi:uncharacterized membrane protein YqjE